eukprot:CAMPEP_0203757314 /NCGR_PEP_ID=MMETSP0098-20131031/10430_1 /ASSEMBLY_ACC=CAM_ASM_000208 /TAXON_ID=96639 /ORGANISM=" , Strain NY0313808BC1" /LENGTH=667 /DNA_ID=CAMNT_0050649517 /DNA_START=120 /DNA_END=2123 /DNA_ORIENTATION=-
MVYQIFSYLVPASGNKTGYVDLSIHSINGKVALMNRDNEQMVEKTFGRLQKLFQGKTKSKKRQKAGADGGGQHKQFSILLENANGEPVDPTKCTNMDAFTDNRSKLVVDSVGEYVILHNYPRILQLLVGGDPMVGCPLVPYIETEFSENVAKKWSWRHENSATVLSDDRCYFPTDHDIGKRLEVTCSLDTEYDRFLKFTLDNPVMALPERPLVVDRQEPFSSGPVSEDKLRVVTYNLLADVYRYCWDKMFPYCDQETLTLSRRSSLLVREVMDYHADIVCLQEVDSRMVESFWEPQMEQLGFTGKFCPKAGGVVPEGCAVFWRTSKLTCKRYESFKFYDIIEKRKDQHPWLGELFEAIPSLQETVGKVTTVGQVLVLESSIGNSFVLGNTHSFYHPGAGNVRCIQAKLMTDEMEELRSSDATTGAILCGDLNAQSFDLSVKFLLEGKIDAGHKEWATSSLFEWGSRANLARDAIFEDEEGPRYGPTVLIDRTLSGRLREVEDIECQVNEFTHMHSSLEKLNVVAELRHLEDHRKDPVERAKIHKLQQKMAKVLEEDKNRLIENQKQLVDHFRAHQKNGEIPKDTRIGLGAYLCHSLNLDTACGTPKFTNYVGTWYGDLDWILYSKDHFKVERSVDFPTETQLKVDTALPSKQFPSDHVSLCADLQFL